MSLKPMRPCKRPGCPRLASDARAGYCDAHLKESRRQLDANRPNSNQRGYNYRWQHRRIPFINNHPLCWYCQQGGRSYFESPLFPLDREIIILQLQRNRLQRAGVPSASLDTRIDELQLRRDAIPKLPEAITPTTCIDHFIPHKGNPSLFQDEDDWRSSCDTCHNIKTAKEDGAFGNPVG